MLSGCSEQYPVLNPAGPVGQEELRLIKLSAILVAIVIIPVLALLAYIVYRYRDKPDNKAPFTPEWAHSNKLEALWWGIPIIVIAILGVVTAKTTFALTKPPTTNVKPIVIQVTSLDWKWVFTYPDQKIATVNYAEIPAGVPVQFQITADAPMNSFWVPELGGQEYAMPGMDMRLWLQADKIGTFDGYGANFTGKGFAHMNFKVVSKPQAEFDNWVAGVKKDSPALTVDGYNKLLEQGTSAPTTYSSYPDGLYENTIGKYGTYMNHDMSNMPGMDDKEKK